MTKPFISGHCVLHPFLLVAVMMWSHIFEAFSRPLAKLAWEKMGRHFHIGSLLWMWNSERVLQLLWSGTTQSFFNTPFTWMYVKLRDSVPYWIYPMYSSAHLLYCPKLLNSKNTTQLTNRLTGKPDLKPFEALLLHISRASSTCRKERK